MIEQDNNSYLACGVCGGLGNDETVIRVLGGMWVHTEKCVDILYSQRDLVTLKIKAPASAGAFFIGSSISDLFLISLSGIFNPILI